MFEIVKQVFDEAGWKYLESDAVIKLDVDGQNSAWSSFLKLEDEDSFSYYSVLPAKAGEEKLTLCMELIQLINYSLKVGSFEMNISKAEDAQRGQILFKTYGLIGADIAKTSVEAAKSVIQKAVAYNMLTMDYYAPIFLKAIYGESKEAEKILSE